MDLRERSGSARRHPWEVARSGFFRQLIGQHVDLPGVARVLDVGAGDGWLAHELAPDLALTARIVCWDVNYRSEDLATPAGDRITRTAQRPEGPFDLVLLLDVIEHVEDDEAFVGLEVVPLLAEGGTAVVSVPAHPGLYSDHDRMLGHHRRYRPNELRALLGRHLTVSASGSLFTTLLVPRAFEVLLERAGRHSDPKGVGAWSRGPALTAGMTAALRADISASRFLSRHGVPVPGLSTWAVCGR